MIKRVIFFAFLSVFVSLKAMTEFGIMVTKDHYAAILKASVYNEALFKNQLNDYAAFLKQTNEKDLYIFKALDQHFKQVMNQNRIELDRAQNDLNEWQESIKNEYFLKDTNKRLVLSGIACGGFSIGIGYLLFLCIKNPTMGDGDGVLGGFLGVFSLASGLVSALLLAEGWDYTKPLQDKVVIAKERIKSLDFNYAYWLDNKEKLNN